MAPVLDRRQLLRGLALSSGFAAFGGLGLMIDQLQLYAEETDSEGEGGPEDDHYFIFCNFPGGWDVLLSLDPRDPAKFNEDNMQSTQIYPAFSELDNPPDQGEELVYPLGRGGMMLGPYVGGLTDHAEDLLVVRGMNMESLAHQAATVRFLTGKVAAGGTPRGSSTDAWLASELSSRDDLIPNLSLEVDSFNKGLDDKATAMEASGLEDLKNILRRFAGELDNRQRDLVQDFLSTQSRCPQTEDSETLQRAEKTRAKAARILEQKLARRFDFSDDKVVGDSGEQLGDLYDLDSEFDVQAAIAATSVIEGISRVVSCRMCRNLDSHGGEWSSEQGRRQQTGFDAVARMVDHLKSVEYEGTGDSWFDHTTIVGFSEFSRTPLLNDRGGRDHWLMNACFLLGGDIAGGQVIGESTDHGMYPKSVDLETGEIDAGGTNLHPEHIIQAMYERAGIVEFDNGTPTGGGPDLRVQPLRAIYKS